MRSGHAAWAPESTLSSAPTSYRIRLDIDLVGTPVMALVQRRAVGAEVRIYTRNGTWSKWVKVARTCI
ncbi:hypothetical protein IAE33_000848 [Pseudomonas sp. S60]|nr:hypothetical protein [Pseudomonas sp. S60]